MAEKRWTSVVAGVEKIWKVEPTAFDDRLYGKSEGMRENKNNSHIFGISKRVNGDDT